MSKCIGCGANLQNESRAFPGYVENLSFSYCERCFRNVHYSEIKEEKLNMSNEDIINTINLKSDLTFFITDFLNINEEIINLYKNISTNKYLVINKMDVIPKDIKDNKIINLLKDVYDINKSVLFTSFKINNLPKYFTSKSIYFCGITNSGKTSLISKITNNNNLTKSNMINTTLDYLKIKYDNYNLVDCPGFIIDNNYVDSKYLKVINPTKVLKIRNFQVKEKTSLNIHDIFKITFINSNNVSCYLSNGLIIKKDYHDLDSYIKLDIPANSDLIIKGIGFINIKNKGVIKIPNDLKYEIRKSIF